MNQEKGGRQERLNRDESGSVTRKFLKSTTILNYL